MSEQSCLVEHFSRLRALSDDEIQLIRDLEKDVRLFPAETRLQAIGAPAESFFTLNQGWACAVRILANGHRQVLDLFLPGQVMGLREIGFDSNHSEIVALSDIEACPFPRSRLQELFDQAPQLGELFLIIMAREQALLTERMINIGRRSAQERLAHFLLELYVRLACPVDDLELPMNQTIIGDALGLSAVHVSRTLSGLKEIKLVDSDNGCIRIRDPEGLAKLADFDHAYLNCSLPWSA